ncbi:MAG: sulfate adenylyltransferase subunit CysN [Thermoanaerobaculia bacterium]|nr:MAG: sulfate adenylyltransferase subunit CysN [Thermoanaerobaculia bacterium]MBZ0101463.1 sulfate adenylyltransferase subunit CysN [Thermoanaerobaculia bacterium]
MSTAPPVTTPGFESFLAAYQQRDLLRLLTCGSVDDGKSTLIGRLLHDSNSLFDDQMAALEKASSKHGTTGGDIDFALLLDGLAAEREQGITIDVAYRYFSTPRRKFIIADTPGHVQYTRNMATGSSNCDLAVILVDARKGVVDQTRRHAFIATLLGVRHLVLAVNKMDLVDYRQEVFEQVREQFTDFASRLQVSDVHFIPVSALAGENLVRPASRMPWYQGGSLLAYLESVHIAGDRNLVDLRFPIQIVQRPSADFRGFGGTVASGILRRGAEVVALPSGRRSRIRSIHTFDGELEEAFPPQSVTVTLEDELDLSRGAMLVAPGNVPHLEHSFEAMLVWMAEEPMRPGASYVFKHTTAVAPATVSDLRYRINVSSLHREPTDQLELNDIGRVRIESPRLIAWDSYRKNRETGAFILIDRLTNATVAAGTILEREPAEMRLDRPLAADAGANVRPQASRIPASDRARLLGQKPVTVWLTGLPRAGKSTVAFAFEERLFAAGHKVQVLDGEGLRLGLNSDLGFSHPDRREHVRRTAEVARLFNDQGFVVLAALVSPTLEDRELARTVIGAERFVEVHCSAPLEICEARDTDRLFERARSGEIGNVTGIDAPYEAPTAPDLDLPTGHEETAVSVERIWRLLAERGLL